jgi:hypothetical protein
MYAGCVWCSSIRHVPALNIDVLNGLANAQGRMFVCNAEGRMGVTQHSVQFLVPSAEVQSKHRISKTSKHTQIPK